MTDIGRANHPGMQPRDILAGNCECTLSKPTPGLGLCSGALNVSVAVILNVAFFPDIFCHASNKVYRYDNIGQSVGQSTFSGQTEISQPLLEGLP